MTENNHPPGRSLTLPSYLLLALVLAAVVFVRIRLMQTPLERDEGEYAYMGQLFLKGIPPYLNAYTMKLPGVAAAYAVIMLIFGQSVAGIHLGLLVVNGICLLFVFLLAGRLFDRDAAILCCAFFALLSLSQSVFGVYAHATHFVLMFALPGAYLLLRARDLDRPVPLFASGLLFGLSFTMKQHAALFIVFACSYLLWRGVRDRACTAGQAISGLALFLTGTLIPYALILLYYLRAGRFEPLWFWTVQYAREYASGQSLSQGLLDFTDAWGYLFTTQPLLWLLAGLGLFLFGTGRGRCSDRPFLFGFLLFSFLSVCPGLYFRKHYFVTLLPAAALLSGAAASAVPGFLAAQKLGRYRQHLPFLLCLICVAFGLFHEKNYFFRRTPLEVSRSLYGINPFPEMREVARYLKEHTGAADRIAVLGSEPELYFYADRLSASGHIYMYGLMEDQPYAERMQRELISEIESVRPRYLVLVNSDTSWLRQTAAPLVLAQWQDRFLREFYHPVGIVEIFASHATRYLWDSQVTGYRPRSDSYLTVYQRKG